MEEYVLDFLVPQGPTGPEGPNLPICYVDYNTSTNGKKLSIKDSKILNSNGDFSINGNVLSVNAGIYEITFCGRMDVKEAFQNNIMVSLHENLGGGYSQPVSGMTMILAPGTNCMHFSETRIIHFTADEELFVMISNNNTASATVSMGSLILKKIG